MPGNVATSVALAGGAKVLGVAAAQLPGLPVPSTETIRPTGCTVPVMGVPVPVIAAQVPGLPVPSTETIMPSFCGVAQPEQFEGVMVVAGAFCVVGGVAGF